MKENPRERFGQALFNLKVNVFADAKAHEKFQFSLRDIYNDSNEEIILRMVKTTQNS